MIWQKMNQYYLKNEEHTICKVKVNEQTTFELWHKSTVIEQGIESLTIAMEKYEELSK